MNCFVNRLDCHYQQRDGGKYFLVKEPITETLISHHLLGTITLGVPSISEQQTCKWVCFDDDSDQPWRLDRIYEMLHNDSYHPLKEGARANRAGHIWLFFDEPLELKIAYDFGLIIKRGCGIADRLEYFPKQRIMQSNSIGNCVKMPCGIHRKLLPDILRQK